MNYANIYTKIPLGISYSIGVIKVGKMGSLNHLTLIHSLFGAGDETPVHLYTNQLPALIELLLNDVPVAPEDMACRSLVNMIVPAAPVSCRTVLLR